MKMNEIYEAPAVEIVKVAVEAGFQPTTIGKDAFKDNTKIESLDLSKTTSFGASAFEGATSFVGVTKTGASLNNNDVVILIATSIPEKAFMGTAIVRFQLKNATTVGASITDLFVKSLSDLAAFTDIFGTRTVDDTDWD